MMHALAHHLAVEWRSALRSPSQLLMAWLFPLGFALVVGTLMPQLNPAFRDQQVAAFALLAVLSGSLLGLPGSLVELRSAGTLRGLRVVGVPDAASLAIPGLSVMLHGVMSALLVAGLSATVLGGAAPAHPAGFAGALALSCFTFVGLGTLIGTVALSSRATVLYSQLLFLPSMLLGGMMVPFSALPAQMRPWSLLLPSTHAMQLLGALGAGQPTPLGAPWHAGVLAASGLIAWALAFALFDTEPRELKAWRGALAVLALAPLGLAALAAR